MHFSGLRLLIPIVLYAGALQSAPLPVSEDTRTTLKHLSGVEQNFLQDRDPALARQQSEQIRPLLLTYREALQNCSHTLLQGQVAITLVVDHDGRVRETEIVRHRWSTPALGEKIESLALAQIHQWQWKPVIPKTDTSFQVTFVFD